MHPAPVHSWAQARLTVGSFEASYGMVMFCNNTWHKLTDARVYGLSDRGTGASCAQYGPSWHLWISTCLNGGDNWHAPVGPWQFLTAPAAVLMTNKSRRFGGLLLVRHACIHMHCEHAVAVAVAVTSTYQVLQPQY